MYPGGYGSYVGTTDLTSLLIPLMSIQGDLFQGLNLGHEWGCQSSVICCHNIHCQIGWDLIIQAFCCQILAHTVMNQWKCNNVYFGRSFPGQVHSSQLCPLNRILFSMHSLKQFPLGLHSSMTFSLADPSTNLGIMKNLSVLKLLSNLRCWQTLHLNPEGN